MRILVTGGAGFIGSALVRLLISEYPVHSILNLDKLSYAGNLDNLAAIEASPRYQFVRGDIADAEVLEQVFVDFQPEAVLHLAAESHVDRSILSPAPVFETNLRGTFTLLQAARRHQTERFVQISTDEVYGSLAPPHEADESYPLQPSSPYSASKAGADLLALSYGKTYGMPVMVTRASNNYGAYQFPEKLIPLMVTLALENRPLPVYGDGTQIRDWLYVDDHCRGIIAVLEHGRFGEIYNIAGTCSLPNIDVVKKILQATGRPESLIRFVGDRPGHDIRYALTSRKLKSETSWVPRVDFEDGLDRTVRWYRDNTSWLDRVRTGEYQNYFAHNYATR